MALVTDGARAHARMVAAAARRLRDRDVVLVGVGIPGEAATLAQRTHAPHLTLVYESGAVGSRPEGSPLSIGDPTLFAGAIASLSLADTFAFVIESGRVDVAFVGAAEIDRYARLNSTVIGPYSHPKTRLPGSGGASEIVADAGRVLVITPLDRRRFPKGVQFVTSTPGADSEVVIVTDRAVLVRPPGETELRLASLFEGETAESVAQHVGWPLAVADDVGIEPDPI